AEERAVSSDAPSVAAKMPTSRTASPILASASDVGSPTCDRWLTEIPRGASTSAAEVISNRDSAPPSGKPMYTFARLILRSCLLQCSSTAPEEKKNTSYGVIAAPNRAIAKYQYVGRLSEEGTWGCAASESRPPQSGWSRQTATPKTTSASPRRPKIRSIVSNFTRQITSQTSAPTSGIQSR